jgi:hypothetical protein
MFFRHVIVFDIGIGIHIESQLNMFRFVDDISRKTDIFLMSEIWGRAAISCKNAISRTPVLWNENSYLSGKRIASILSIYQTTVKYVLREDLLLRKVNFKWIPHLRDQNRKSKSVRFSTELLRLRGSKSECQLANVYTGDETWIYYNNPRSSMWAGVDVARPICARPFIEEKKRWFGALSRVVELRT